MEGVQRDRAISHALKAADAITAASCLASFRPGQMPAMPELDENSWHCRVDPGNVVGVAGDDGMTTLPGAEHDMYVNDVVLASAHISPTLRATLSVMTAMSMPEDLSSLARRAWRELRHACATTSAGMQIVPPRRRAASNRACIATALRG
jgi:hypothetical protein